MIDLGVELQDWGDDKPRPTINSVIQHGVQLGRLADLQAQGFNTTPPGFTIDGTASPYSVDAIAARHDVVIKPVIGVTPNWKDSDGETEENLSLGVIDYSFDSKIFDQLAHLDELIADDLKRLDDDD